MKITSFILEDFRNISALSLKPCENVNILYGDNAQGKTNLIEAIWLFTGNTSFRGAKSSELIAFDKEFTKLSLEFSDREREQKASLLINQNHKKKRIILNSVPLSSLSELNGYFYAVVFSPVHLSLIKDGPKNRRKFLDIAIAQIKPQYENYLSIYEQALCQRNALLKNRTQHGNGGLADILEVWDRQLAKTGTIISIYRNDYLKKLSKLATQTYDGLSSGNEKLELFYSSTVFKSFSEIKSYDEEVINEYMNRLKETLDEDLKVGFTAVGPHKDDLEVTVNKRSARMYGSQGQQRSAVIALKLSEAELLKRVTGENPIMLLDDVMSELDISRQDYILNHVKDLQVFITCCDVVNTKGLLSGKIFKIKEGCLKEQTQIDKKPPK